MVTRRRTLLGRKLDFWVSLPSPLLLTSSAPESSARGVDTALDEVFWLHLVYTQITNHIMCACYDWFKHKSVVLILGYQFE